jgi:uncharacterized protein YjbJ (UPF0337 family)
LIKHYCFHTMTKGDLAMSLEERAKATAKNIEGKAQEAIGKMTGDPQAQVEGEAKQAEAKARHGKEDVKDGVKNVVDKA